MNIQMNVDEKQMLLATKESFINAFNEAVQKKASKAYLTSLHRTTRQEIIEINRAVGYLPEDGLNRLNKEWFK